MLTQKGFYWLWGLILILQSEMTQMSLNWNEKVNFARYEFAKKALKRISFFDRGKTARSFSAWEPGWTFAKSLDSGLIKMSASNPFFATYQTFSESRFFWSLFENNFEKNSSAKLMGCISKYLNPILMQFASCWLSRQKVLKSAYRPFSSKKHHFPSERLNFFTQHCAPPRSSRRHLDIISWFFLQALTFFLPFWTFEFIAFIPYFSIFSLTWTFELFGVFIGASEAIGDSVAEFVDLEDL